MNRLIFQLLFLLFFYPSGLKSYAIESFNSFSNVEKSESFSKQLALLDIKIACEKQKDAAAIDLYTERGILLLATEQYKRAVDDFTHVLERSEVNADSFTVGIALWGKTLGNAALNKTVELNENIDDLAKFINLYEDCECRQSANTTDFPEIQFSSHYTEDNENSYEFCRMTVENTVKFMKRFVDNFPTFGAKWVIFDLIDELGERALKCCRGAGFWRNCVQPMSGKMNVWKKLGYIPAQT